MNRRIFNNNAFDDSAEKLKPVIKTVFLNTDSGASFVNFFVGIALLFFCILAGTVGVVLCLADSFSLEITFGRIFLQSFLLLIIFTVIYLLPSRLFTAVSFLTGAGLFSLYIYTHFEEIYRSLYYTLNLCLYKIAREGYIIGNIVDYGLAREPNPDAEKFINTSIFLVTLAIVCIFSYIVYSKKSMWIALAVSLIVIFPGFFYGFIPAYFSFSIIVAFWVSVFAVNIFETGYIENFIDRSNRVPEKKFGKYKYKLFKEQYYKNVKAIKSEIAKIVKSPNREDNSLRLNRLVRELQQISNNQDWFLRFYGLNKLYKPKKKNIPESIDLTNAQKVKKPKKEKIQSLLKLEKLRIKEEKRAERKKQIEEFEAKRKALGEMTVGKRFKLYLKQSFSLKVERSTKSGYVGFFAFTIALAATIIAQPFVSPQAKFKSTLPQEVMQTLTNTVEYILVGSNSRVYGGYSGGMGGGFLLNPQGANFQYKPILRLRPIPVENNNYSNRASLSSDTFRSGVVYLKNWYGNMYNGQRWFEADKNHVEAYDEMRSGFIAGGIDESNYFEVFTRYMQELFTASTDRRGAELRKDSIIIEHLVTGGRASFIPYFTYDVFPFGNNFAMQKTADLNISLARPLNALFRYPEYAAQFYSVDNVLNRSEIAVEDLKQYLNYYENYFPQDLETANEMYNLMLERRREERAAVNEVLYSFGFTDADITWRSEGYYYYVHVYNNIPPDVDMDKVNEAIAEVYRNINDTFYFGEQFRVSLSSVVAYTVNFDYLKDMEPFYNAESAYYDFVMEHYLDVSEDFPQEVIDLTLEIVQDANAVTNFEKALAIEKYLAENHEYTLHPMMPDDPTGDFVYNFLFQTKEGYCTYYATSMVMMMRTLGIPARYAEGYLVDMRRRQRDTDDNVFITVYDSNGHAWPEVYFRGIGWIPFEPTTAVIETPAETEPYVYNPPARLPGFDMMGEMTTMSDDYFYDDDFVRVTEQQVDYFEIFLRVGIILGIILIILAFSLVNRFINAKRLKYFKTAKSKDAVVKMLAYTLKFLKHCGFVIHNDEGLNKFAERVSANLEIFSNVGFKQTAEIMQRARYSNHETNERDRVYVYDFIKAMNTNANKQLKPNLKIKFKYLYFIL